MSKREVSKLNKDNLFVWQSLMKLHLRSIGDYAQTSIGIEHVTLASTLTTNDLNKKEHNQAMLEIASALNYVEFDDIKGCNTDQNVESLVRCLWRRSECTKSQKRKP